MSVREEELPKKDGNGRVSCVVVFATGSVMMAPGLPLQVLRAQHSQNVSIIAFYFEAEAPTTLHPCGKQSAINSLSLSRPWKNL